MERIKAEVVVVGSGSGGATGAARGSQACSREPYAAAAARYVGHDTPGT